MWDHSSDLQQVELTKEQVRPAKKLGKGEAGEYQAQVREANDGWMGMEGQAICKQNGSEAGLVQGASDCLHFCSVCMGATGLKL